MKPGPVIAMIALIFVGMWLVLQPALKRDSYEISIRIGGEELLATQHTVGRDIIEDGQLESSERFVKYRFVAPAALAELGLVSSDEFDRIVFDRIAAWQARPALERTLLGFFNISSWTNFAWVGVGLLGQIAFFGRMMVQWVISEKSRKSQVPEMFWWLSLIGGVFLFTYFVWRVDVVGVLGQSTGVVIYARNLRLIHKDRKREARRAGLAQDSAGENPSA